MQHIRKFKNSQLTHKHSRNNYGNVIMLAVHLARSDQTEESINLKKIKQFERKK